MACLIATALSQNHTHRPVQHGFTTRQRSLGAPSRIHGVQQGYAGPYGGGGAGGGGGGGGLAPQGGGGGGDFAPQGGGGGGDFNPQLQACGRGNPGIKARINQRGFQYFSSLIAPILDQEIKRAHIPPINQCIPEVSGCIQVYNLFVSRYRCPQRVIIYPGPPNQIVIAVQNLDVGVTGNLGGQINIILPLKLFGIVQVNAHQVSITVQLAITRGPSGGPYVSVVGCQASVGYLDAYIQNGGLIGDIANSQFRGQISNRVRQMIPSQLCAQIPTIVNEKINGQLGALPQSIALTQILQVAGGALGLGGGGASGISGGGASGAGGCGGGASPGPAPQYPSTPCHSAQKTPQLSKPLPLPPPAVIAVTKKPQILPPSSKPSSVPASFSTAPRAQTSSQKVPYYNSNNPPPPPTYAAGVPPPTARSLPQSSNSPYSKRHVILSNAPFINYHPISNTRFINSASTDPRVANRFIRDTRPHGHLSPSSPSAR
uniref:Lipid-binding serum glycoprotein N-terminal domain-containing protein n=1 Tax=Panagrolaimus superbus TaxID=310955 RepID=A0A914YUG3_9BILA